MADASREDLYAEVQRLREQRHAISAVLRAVASSGALQPVLDEITASAQRLCDGEHSQLYLLEDGLLHIHAFVGDEEAYEYARNHPHALDRTTVVGRAALAHDVVQIPDVLEDPEYTYAAQTIRFRALLGVPIILDDELIGAITAGRNVPGPFTDEQIELVKTFADQAAIA